MDTRQVLNLKPIEGNGVQIVFDRGQQFAEYNYENIKVRVLYDIEHPYQIMVYIINNTNDILKFREENIAFESSDDTNTWLIEPLKTANEVYQEYYYIATAAGKSPLIFKSLVLFSSDISRFNVYGGNIWLKDRTYYPSKYYRLTIKLNNNDFTFLFTHEKYK
jgi:hypothetical protein